MNNYRREYFNDHCYFLIEGNGNNFTLTYSTYTIITESEKKDKKNKIKKENIKNVEEKIKKITKSNKKVSKKEIEKELDEFVDIDGTMLSSKIPFLNMYLHPKKTMDQTIRMTKDAKNFSTNPPRSYGWGESEEKGDDVLSEIDMSDAFGYEETEFKDMKGSLKALDKMGIDDPVNKLERARKFGKRKDTKVFKNKKGEKVIKNLNLFEKQTLDEIKRQKMIKMVEDIISKKDKGESDVVSKDSPMSRLLTKNLESIKKLAEKEGISINKLINILKKGE